MKHVTVSESVVNNVTPVLLSLYSNVTPGIISFHSHLLPFSLPAPASPGHPSATLSICPAHPPLLSASSADPAAPPPATSQIHKQTIHIHRNRTHQRLKSLSSTCNHIGY